MRSLSRRVALKYIGLSTTFTGLNQTTLSAEQGKQPLSEETVDRWGKTNDRVWLGEQFWANPMEDWVIKDGSAECQSLQPNRSVHLLTQQLEHGDQPFEMVVQLQQVEQKGKDAGAGFRIGVRSDINEYRSNCFASSGLNAGFVDGQLALAGKRKAVDLDPQVPFLLVLSSQPTSGKANLTLQLLSSQGELIDSISNTVGQDQLLGNVAIVNNYSPAKRRNRNNQQPAAASRYRFNNWAVAGPAFAVHDKQKFGPILWTMYSLSDSRSDEGFVMKLTALTGPLGESDNKTVQLQIQRNGKEESLGEAELDEDSWTATFRIPNWDANKPAKYRVVYNEKLKDGTTVASDWTGEIKANPAGRPLRMAALTCQNDYGFPYEPVANNVVNLDPDLCYFSGDQIYESHGGYGIIRDPADRAILNYLRKFYQFGWAFRDAIKDRPTLCIPDDHDVFQGNIWGEGGAKMKDLDAGASSKGGYREPARMVNAVHKTCVSHHPDFYDPTPVKQDISVYYGDMVYGNVSFAIIADRQWKNGPEHVETGSGRADHVSDPDFDTSVLDKPGLVLLGERQEEFLRKWAQDWRGHEMKVLLSQTVFAGVATHHGNANGYLKADLDSGGWPQTARNRAIDIVRDSKALHINGDQHLTTLCQYGVHQQRDSNWSFCTPAIAAGYPRWWRPDEIGMKHENRPQHGLANTGEFIDGLGNLVYVYTVGNPAVNPKGNRYERAHQKGSGFGMVTIDTVAKTYHIEAFRFIIDATQKSPDNQFPGWPVTIHQDENAGRNKLS